MHPGEMETTELLGKIRLSGARQSEMGESSALVNMALELANRYESLARREVGFVERVEKALGI